MQANRARRHMAIIFFAGFLIQACFVVAANWRGFIGSKDTNQLLTVLLGIYSPHFGLILGAIFAADQRASAISKPLLQVAYSLTLVWNIIFVVLSAHFVAAAFFPNVDDSARNLTDAFGLGAPFSILVAGPLSYVFNKRS